MGNNRWVAALIAMGMTFAVPGAADAATPVAGHVRVAIASAASTADFSQSPGRNRYVILNEWEVAKLRSLKAANPSIKVLLYQNLSAMAARDVWGNVSTGVTTQEADPAWYLLDTGGRRFTFWGYSWLYATDVGNPGYQQRWADNVLTKLRSGGWDGVFMDDTNPTIKYHYDTGSVAKYPTDAQYGAATRTALAAIGPRLRAAGKLVIPNFGAWREYRSVVDDWLQFVDGGMEEMLAKWSANAGEGYLTGADWSLQLDAIKTAESRGKVYLGVTHGGASDVAAARYGWATVLLAAQGGASFAFASEYADEHWFDEFDYNLGAPLAPETADPTGVHRRLFSNGLALVNPTQQTVVVGFGARYSGSGLSHATQATMGPHTGLVLTADSPAVPTAPAPTATPTPVPPTATPAPVEPAPATTPAPTATATPAPTPAARRPRRRKRGPAATASIARSVRATARCPKGRRPCRRVVTVVLPVAGRSAVVTGRRTVTVRPGQSLRVAVAIDDHGQRALAGGGSLIIRVG